MRREGFLVSSFEDEVKRRGLVLRHGLAIHFVIERRNISTHGKKNSWSLDFCLNQTCAGWIYLDAYYAVNKII